MGEVVRHISEILSKHELDKLHPSQSITPFVIILFEEVAMRFGNDNIVV